MIFKAPPQLGQRSTEGVTVWAVAMTLLTSDRIDPRSISVGLFRDPAT